MQGWEGKGGHLEKAAFIQREKDVNRQRLERSFNLFGFDFSISFGQKNEQ